MSAKKAAVIASCAEVISNGNSHAPFNAFAILPDTHYWSAGG
jgi:hypothetical protein